MGLDVVFRLAVCSFILSAILIPDADVSVATDDAVLAPYLTTRTNVQLDSDLMKTPAMEGRVLMSC